MYVTAVDKDRQKYTDKLRTALVAEAYLETDEDNIWKEIETVTSFNYSFSNAS